MRFGSSVRAFMLVAVVCSAAVFANVEEETKAAGKDSVHILHADEFAKVMRKAMIMELEEQLAAERGEVYEGYGVVTETEETAEVVVEDVPIITEEPIIEEPIIEVETIQTPSSDDVVIEDIITTADPTSDSEVSASIIDDVIDQIEMMIKALSEYIAIFIDNINAEYPIIVSKGFQLVENAQSTVITGCTSLKESISSLVSSTSTSTRDWTVVAEETTVHIMHGVAERTQSGLEYMKDKMVNAWECICMTPTAFGTGIQAAVADFIANFWDNMTGGLMAIGANALNFLTAIGETVTTGFMNIGAPVVNMVSYLCTLVVDSSMWCGSAVWSGVKALPTGLSNGFTALFSDASSFVADTWQPIRGLLILPSLPALPALPVPHMSDQISSIKDSIISKVAWPVLPSLPTRPGPSTGNVIDSVSSSVSESVVAIAMVVMELVQTTWTAVVQSAAGVGENVVAMTATSLQLSVCSMAIIITYASSTVPFNTSPMFTSLVSLVSLIIIVTLNQHDTLKADDHWFSLPAYLAGSILLYTLCPLLCPSEMRGSRHMNYFLDIWGVFSMLCYGYTTYGSDVSCKSMMVGTLLAICQRLVVFLGKPSGMSPIRVQKQAAYPGSSSRRTPVVSSSRQPTPRYQAPVPTS
eukprot:Ihof_evm2s194 gene=Ihof_evmTU2s194